MNPGDRVRVLRGFFAGKTGVVLRLHSFAQRYHWQKNVNYLVKFENGREVNFRGSSCLRVITPLELLAEVAE